MESLDIIHELIMKNSSDAIIAFDMNRRYTIWNKKMAEISGMPAQKVLGQVAEEIFPFLIDNGEIDCFNGALNGETVTTAMQTFSIPESGKKGYFSAKYMPIRNAEGKIIGGLGILREITDQIRRQQLEKMHSSSLERFDTIFQNAPMGIQIYNQQGKCIYVNSVWEKVFESVISELDDYNVFQDQQLEQFGVLAKMRAVLQGESFHLPPVFFDPKLSGKKGGAKWIESFGFPIKNEKDEPEICLLTIDATAMMATLKTKEESELRFKGLADALPVMVWVTDLRGEVEYINDRWFDYTGQPKEFSRQVWMDAVHPDDLQDIIKKQIEALETNGQFTIEYRIKGKDGKYRWYLAKTLCIKDSSGKPFKRFGAAAEIEEHKRAIESQKESIRARDEFLSIASHELKTPLTSLGLQNHIRFSFLNDGEPLPHELLQSWFEKEAKQLAKLNRLIDDMLDISRIKTGRLALQKENVNIPRLVEDVVERYRPELTERCGGVFLETIHDFEACIDPFRFEQVMTNLLTNAMKYGNGKPVSVSVKVMGKDFEVLVKDQGLGIALHDQMRIFERFERAIPSHQVSGLGLGLAIAKDIVEAHKGSITVSSRLGAGSEFYVRLPIGLK